MSTKTNEFVFSCLSSEELLPAIINLVEKDLSEPYCIYTYRYFTYAFPQLTFVVFHNSVLVGAIVSRLEQRNEHIRGYIGMLAIEKSYRNRGLASKLVAMSINAMKKEGAAEIVLEAEITNQGALRLYKKFGFIKEKRLERYYLNGVDAFRLKLWLK